MIRDPAKMTCPLGSGGSLAGKALTDSRLILIQGSVTSADDVDRAFSVAKEAIDGVVIALGGKTKDVGPTMLTDGTLNIINSMKKANVKRVSVVTSIGAGDSESQAPLFFKALMYTVMKGIFTDKNNQEKLFLDDVGPGHDLEWCIVRLACNLLFPRFFFSFASMHIALKSWPLCRPGGLGEGPATGVINVIDGQAGSIQRADVAAFCLGAISDASFPYIRRTPCISSIGGTGWVKVKFDLSYCHQMSVNKYPICFLLLLLVPYQEPKKGFDEVNTA